MALPTLPGDLVNRSLDALGVDALVGNLFDGTRESEAARRIYAVTLRQLLRAAHWSFARKSASLLLLADATGQTIDVATGQAISNAVEAPWAYAYAWPNDGVAARWLPWQNQVNPQAIPPTTKFSNSPSYPQPQPAAFLVTSSDQFPAMAGQVDWDNLPDLGEGQGPISRRIILTNVPGAILVYTKLALAIEEWDSLFDEAMVAVLASRLAMSVVPDKKLAMTLRGQQVMIAKEAVTNARVASANESGFPKNLGRVADFHRARHGGIGGAGVWGEGVPYFYGWSPMSWADGSVF